MLSLLDNNLLLSTAVLCGVVQLLSWLWQLKTQNTDIVDISWSILVVACSLVYFFNGSGDYFHLGMILLIPVFWYLRLSWHLITRYRISHEDGRYQALREHWSQGGSKGIQLKLFSFFMFQAALAWLFSYPAYIVSNLQQSFSALDLSAMLLLSISLVGVTLSDWQLAQFKKNKKPQNPVCNIGLWKYSRHPNYFFEWIHWFCYPLLGISTLNVFSLDAFILIVAPFVMLLFLLKLTGIPFNEEQNIRSKGDAYRQYQQVTNMFFLGKPKTS